jgi:hypothetical protein
MDMKANGSKVYSQVDPIDLNNPPQMQFEVGQFSHQPIFDATSKKDILPTMGSLYVGCLQQWPLVPSSRKKTPSKQSPSWEPSMKQQDRTWSLSPNFSPLRLAFPFFGTLPSQTISLSQTLHGSDVVWGYPTWQHAENGYSTKIVFRCNPNEISSLRYRSLNCY